MPEEYGGTSWAAEMVGPGWCRECAPSPDGLVDGGVSRLPTLTLDPVCRLDGDWNLEWGFASWKFVGGGNSKVGRFDAAGRRAVNG